jgi:glycine betaine/proline transport system substrate-binding protein
MTSLADSHQPAVKVAKEWLKTHTDILDKWLDGVTTADGAPALPAVKAYLAK